MTYLLGGEVSIQTIKDIGGRTPMRALRSETVSGEGRDHFEDEGGMQVDHGGQTVLGSMCLLPHLDSPLRANCRSTLRLVEEGAEVQMGRRALRGNGKTKRDVDGSSGSPEGGLWEGDPDIRDKRHESDGDRVGDHLGR